MRRFAVGHKAKHRKQRCERHPLLSLQDFEPVQIACHETAIRERCKAEDYLIKFQSRELGAGFHVPEPDGVVTGA